MRSRGLILSFALLIALTLGLASVSLASPTATTNSANDILNMDVGKDGWIEYQGKANPYPLEDPSTLTRQGKRASDGTCKFEGKMVLQPKQNAIEERPQAVNLNTCEERVIRGVPTKESMGVSLEKKAANNDPHVSSKEDERKSHPRDDAVSKAKGDAAASYWSAGFLKTWWENPVNLDVNLVRNNTGWYWNGSRVTGARGGYRYYWLSASGWDLRGNNWRNSWTSYQTTSSSYAHYRNPIFCRAMLGIFGSTTHVYYDRNTVHGRYNGALVGRWNSYKSGGCNRLLSFNKVLRRTA